MEKPQIDIFAIIILIFSISMLVYLIISAIYYMNIMNFTIPSSTEATFLFWTSIVMSIIVSFIILFSFYRIYTHRSYIFDYNKNLVSVPVTIVQRNSNVPVTIVPQRNSKVPVTIVPQRNSDVQIQKVQQRNSDVQIQKVQQRNSDTLDDT